MRPVPAATLTAATLTAATLAAAALALAGCSSDAGASGTTVTVLAAASLRESFTELAADYESTHPTTTVRLGFGASSALAQQILQGAPADVFASASGAPMQQVLDAGEVQQPQAFATNRLTIVTPPADPAAIDSLDDLSRVGVKVAVCAEQVPCGTAATEVLRRAGLQVTPVTFEADAKATLSKVLLGEVDAALVYVTDAQASGDRVRVIDIPADLNPASTYPLAVLDPDDEQAQDFADFVLSPQGQAVLQEYGFGAP